MLLLPYLCLLDILTYPILTLTQRIHFRWILLHPPPHPEVWWWIPVRLRLKIKYIRTIR